MTTVLSSIVYDVEKYINKLLMSRLNNNKYNFFDDFRENIEMILTPIEEHFYGPAYYITINRSKHELHTSYFTTTNDYLYYVINRINSIKTILTEHNSTYSDYLHGNAISAFYDYINSRPTYGYIEHPYMKPLMQLYSYTCLYNEYHANANNLSPLEHMIYKDMSIKIHDKSSDSPFKDISLLTYMLSHLYDVILTCNVIFNTFTLTPEHISTSTLPDIIDIKDNDIIYSTKGKAKSEDNICARLYKHKQ